MPVHDWTRVGAGTFHHFHGAWIFELSERLNAGLLPEGCYALGEQHGGRLIADILTLHVGDTGPSLAPGGGAVAVAQAPPQVSRTIVASPEAAARLLQRTLTIRHASTHRIIALVEIISPANKDRDSHVEDFVAKVRSALAMGIHVLIIDLLPPGVHDPAGLHEAIWEAVGDEVASPPPERPLVLASYLADQLPRAHVEFLAVGDALPEMPLFLDPDFYIPMPLESSYHKVYHGLPQFWREVIEGRRANPA